MRSETETADAEKQMNAHRTVSFWKQILSENAMGEAMDTDGEFENIKNNIKDGRIATAISQIQAIVATTDDVMVMVKCASLLKTLDDESGCKSVIGRAIDSVPDDDDVKYDVGIAIRSLGRPADAFELMECKSSDPSKRAEIARTLLMLSEPEEAMEMIGEISGTVDERIIRCEILSALERHGEAVSEAEKIAEDESDSYVSMVNLVSCMIKAGQEKDALKLAKSKLKSDRKDADALALEAYVMWINGKVPAAANYANKALQIDYAHIGALETMAMCLVTKKKLLQAKMLAGVINENSPGNPAVIRILDACRSALG